MALWLDIHKYGIAYPMHELPDDLVDGYRAVCRGYEYGRQLAAIAAQAAALAHAK